MYITVTPQNRAFFEKMTVAKLARKKNLLKYRDLSLIYVTGVPSTPQVRSLRVTSSFAGDIITFSSTPKSSNLLLFHYNSGY